MDLLRYEFIDGPDGSINGMLRTLVSSLRYNTSSITIDEYHQAMPELLKIEELIQRSVASAHTAKRNYIEEIVDELDKERENDTNISDDLNSATCAIIASLLNRPFNFDDLLYSKGKSEHYNWIQLNGYIDQRENDSELILAKEVFRSICNKYNYIFIDLS